MEYKNETSNSNIKSTFTSWLLPANSAMYNHKQNFDSEGFIEWGQSIGNCNIDDIVYIYCSNNDKKIRYKTKIDKIDITSNKLETKGDYWVKGVKPKTSKKYMKLSLLQEVDNIGLSYSNLKKHGLLSNIQSVERLNSKPALLEYIQSFFENNNSGEDKITINNGKFSKRLIAVDMYSGAYPTKHEEFNKERNIDGKYYGYIPPGGTVEIGRIDPNYKNAEYIDDVFVIYTKAVNDTNKNRQIIAYHESARIYKHQQDGKPKNRLLVRDEYAGYHIMSDEITILDEDRPFIIDTKKINPYLFRDQRCYFDDTYNKEKLEELKQNIFSYIMQYKKKKDNALDEDDEKFQNKIFDSIIDDSLKEKDKDIIKKSSHGESIEKDPQISLKAITKYNFKCVADESHISFTSNRTNKNFVEGHHVIPATMKNLNKYNGLPLDRSENIVSLCPNCHRKIHYARFEEKEAILEIIYKRTVEDLNNIGFNISLEEFKGLYRKID